ncbi:MAG: hypothetical protein IJM25_06040 [Eubacterium sp.]|nr:hypothetical protein [Eubacterium sp.]
MRRQYGKKATILALALSLCLATACGSGEQETTGTEAETVTTKATTEAVTEAPATTEADTVPATEEMTEEVTEEQRPVPNEPQLSLSGKHEDVTEVKETSYYEGDRFILYFEKGAKVHGDIAEVIGKVIKEEEEVYGLSYADAAYLRANPEYLWVLEEFGSDFNGLNNDSEKLNIMIMHYTDDGAIEWSDLNTILLFDEDFEAETNGMKTVYHEMAHLLRLRQSSNLGDILEEGIAIYAEDQLCRKNGIANWDLVQFYDIDGYQANYDASGIQQDPEKMFREINGAERSADQPAYAYGIRFLTFLHETYGADVVKKLTETASKYSFEYDNTDMIIKVLKEATSEDVFERFGKWLPEGWKAWCEGYKAYMKPFGFE